MEHFSKYKCNGRRTTRLKLNLNGCLVIIVLSLLSWTDCEAGEVGPRRQRYTRPTVPSSEIETDPVHSEVDLRARKTFVRSNSADPPSIDPLTSETNLPSKKAKVRDSSDNQVVSDDKPTVVDFPGSNPDGGTTTETGTSGGSGGVGSPGGPEEGPYLDFPGDNPPEVAKPTPDPQIPIPECPADKSPSSPPLKFPDPNESTKLRIQLQDRHILLQAHKNAIFGFNPHRTHEPKGSLTILNMTGETFKKWCPEKAIPGYYVDYVLSVFSELHFYTTANRLPYITDEEVRWIEQLLEKCQGGGTLGTDFVIDPKCRDEILGDKNRQPICSDKSQQFLPGVDPLLDMVFRIFEVVHSACFDFFDGYSRVWHRFVMAIMDLYTMPIRQRWLTTVSSPTFFFQLLGPKYHSFSSNLDKCAHYYGMQTPIKARLHRFPEMYSIRYGPDVENIFATNT